MNLVIYNVLVNGKQAFGVIAIALEPLISLTLMKRAYEALIYFWMALLETLIYCVYNIDSIFVNSIVTKVQQALFRVVSSLIDSGNNATHYDLLVTKNAVLRELQRQHTAACRLVADKWADEL